MLSRPSKSLTSPADRERPRKHATLSKLYAYSVVLLSVVAGCQPQMTNDARYKPLQESNFFGDGLSARTPQPGTVPHGEPENQAAVYPDRGKSPEPRWAASVVGLASAGAFNVLPVYGGAFVFPPSVHVNYDLLKRGRERFNIYCAVCHDRVGTGRGKIVERGYLRPPSYHIDRLRNAPLMHFYDVVSNGYGAMPSYSDKLTPDDRWAVIAYVRALQLSQDVSRSDLTAEELHELQSAKERP
jgi:mono/diheme cytochrome c family protein